MKNIFALMVSSLFVLALVLVIFPTPVHADIHYDIYLSALDFTQANVTAAGYTFYSDHGLFCSNYNDYYVQFSSNACNGWWTEYTSRFEDPKWQECIQDQQQMFADNWNVWSCPGY